MSSLAIETRAAAVQQVFVTEDSLRVDLVDGRTISVPLAWYPRLLHGRPEERDNWRLIGQGEGIHWPELERMSAQRTSSLVNRPARASGRSLAGYKRALGSDREALHAIAPCKVVRRPATVRVGQLLLRPARLPFEDRKRSVAATFPLMGC
jgi:hypothetical protein